MKNQKGFSLIELLIVVVIIGIIAAIAIPNLIAARRAANEGSAQSTTRTIHSAEVTYGATNGNGNYGDLAALAGASLVDTTVSSATGKSGYKFFANKQDRSATSEGTFVVTANPITVGGVTATGTRNFCVATDGVVYAYALATTTGYANTPSASVAAACTAPTSANLGAVVQ